jgi:hypothetical protein
MRFLPVALIVYLAGGIAVWISFVRTHHDGLANVGLVLYVAPVTALGLAVGRLIGRTEFILIPDRFGYLGDHAVFYFPSLLVTTCLIGWAITAIARTRPK